MSDETTKIYGFTALLAKQSLQKPSTNNPQPVAIATLQPPTTPLATRVAAYAKSKLSPETYRHSLRVYSYGCAIARQCFPDFGLAAGSTLEETWFLTAMLHDIGTADEFLTSTRLSFEFWGGFHALSILQDPAVKAGSGGVGDDHGEGSVAPREQAESVAEAIIRHQDIQDKGKITLMTRLIHLGTLLDNIGASAELVHTGTIENVGREYPRSGWTGCFKKTIEKEKAFKPYTMVSRIEDFEELLDKNVSSSGVMAKYENP